MSRYAVIDLEMCKVSSEQRKAGYKPHQEIIQIGAVMLGEDYEIVGKFNRFVKPVFGGLDDFIRNLTGITQEQLDEADVLDTVLKDFAEWLGEEEVYGVSWSKSDSSQLRRELEAKELQFERIDALLDHWIDCQKQFSRQLKTKRDYSLSEALFAADVQVHGKAHDGYDDAYNTALLFAKIQTEPELKLHPIYEEVKKEEVTHLSFSMGDLFSGLGLDFGNNS